MSKKEIRTAVEVMAEAIKGELSISGNEIAVSEGAYYKHLPDGLTREVVDQIDHHNSIYYPAATRAIGEVALEIMTADKDVAHVKTVMPLMGDNHLDVLVHRNKVVTNPGTGEKHDKYGQTLVSLTTAYAKNSGGEMEAARDFIAELAAGMFGAKNS